jgi:hypothetical protein
LNELKKVDARQRSIKIIQLKRKLIGIECSTYNNNNNSKINECVDGNSEISGEIAPVKDTKMSSTGLIYTVNQRAVKINSILIKIGEGSKVKKKMKNDTHHTSAFIIYECILGR